MGSVRILGAIPSASPPPACAAPALSACWMSSSGQCDTSTCDTWVNPEFNFANGVFDIPGNVSAFSSFFSFFQWKRDSFLNPSFPSSRNKCQEASTHKRSKADELFSCFFFCICIQAMPSMVNIYGRLG